MNTFSHIDGMYNAMASDIAKNGTRKEDRTGTGTRSMFGYNLDYYMFEGFPLLTTKKMAFNSIISELLWFLRGDTRIQFLHQNNNKIWDADLHKFYVRRIQNVYTANGATAPEEAILSQEEFIHRIKNDEQFAHYWGNLGPIYPAQWRGGNGRPDQLAQVIHLLKTDPDSRRIIVNSWAPSDIDKMALPPCHVMFQFYTQMGADGIRRLSLLWYQRSADVFLGVPFNIASYATLLRMVSKEVDMQPWKLMVRFGDAHVYNNHIDQVLIQANRDPLPSPQLVLDYEGSLLDIIPELTVDNFKLVNYVSHPALKGEQSS